MAKSPVRPIKKIDSSQPTRPKYFLSYPNEEVKNSFLKNLLASYADKPVFLTENTYTDKMRDALEAGDLESFFRVLSSLFASIPYHIAGTQESYFHTVVHVVLTLTGHVVHSEIPANQGRMDAVLDTGERVYVFEFKLRESTDAALAQIRERGYPGRFRAADKPLTLVGVAFDAEAKNVREWKVFLPAILSRNEDGTMRTAGGRSGPPTGHFRNETFLVLKPEAGFVPVE